MATILITEDDPIIAADLGDRLQDAGYQVETAHDSPTARQLADTATPDLVLMDVNLGQGPDGIATATHLREAYPDLPIIFLTSNSDAATFERARAVRPQGFLSKPFRGRDLLHAVTLAIGSRPTASSSSSKAPTAPAEADVGTDTFTDRIFLRHKERMVRVMTGDIVYLAADDYYCKVVTEQRTYTVTKTLKKFMDTLPAGLRIQRVHRSYAVNIDQVTEIGEIYIFLGEHRVPVSRGKREELMRRMRN